MSQPFPQGGPTPPGGERPQISGLSWAALAVAIPSFCVGWIPFAGFVGTIAIVLAVADLSKSQYPPRPIAVSVIAIVLGGLSTTAALCWVILASTMKVSSCPHVYAHDGAQWRLDADPLSGAILPGAERSDWDRLDHLAAVDGTYRIRVADDLEEIDRIDQVALLVVDHAPGSEALPTPEGAIVEVQAPVAPLQATDRRGRDVAAQVKSADGVAFAGSLAEVDPGASDEPRERLTVTFPRPAGSQATLVLRAHNTPFAEESFARYAARMGPGTGALMDLAQDASWYPYRARITDEIRLLGLPLEVGVAGGPGVELAPIGPAIQRDFAVVVAIPEGRSPTVAVTLAFTPRFWEIDRVALAAGVTPLAPRRLAPRQATGPGGADLVERLATADGSRVELRTGESVELAFDAPAAAAGRDRSVVLEIRGSYEMGFGGRGWLNPVAILAHRRGWDSLPRFAARREQAH
jgi:hypothetical protein